MNQSLSHAVAEMDTSVRCLALELPVPVWEDVNIKWQKVRKLLPKKYLPKVPDRTKS